MSLSVLDESQFFLCLMIADSKSWQQNLRGERKKKIKSPEFYLTEVKKHFFFLQMTVFAYGWSELKVILYIFIKYMKLQRMHLFRFKINPENVSW